MSNNNKKNKVSFSMGLDDPIDNDDFEFSSSSASSPILTGSTFSNFEYEEEFEDRTKPSSPNFDDMSDEEEQFNHRKSDTFVAKTIDFDDMLSEAESEELGRSDRPTTKTEIDLLFEEEEDNDSIHPSQSQPTSVKSPILSASVQSPVGLSQYQKQQQNVYELEDLNQLTPSSPKIEKGQPLTQTDKMIDIVKDRTEEEETSTFHSYEAKQKEPQPATSSQPKLPQQTITSNVTIKAEPKQKEQSSQLSDMDDLDIDFSQLAEELQAEMNSKQEIPPKPSTPINSTQISTKSKSSSASSPQKKPLVLKKIKDEIQCTPEFSIQSTLYPKPIVVDDIENSENSQLELPQLSTPTKPQSPSGPLTWREAIQKSNEKRKPYQEHNPDKELVAIKDQFGLIVFQRGNNYANEERIFEMQDEKVTLEDDVELTFLTSKCWGTVEVPYSQNIVFEEKNMILKKCTCTCPVEDHCKHSCAALITWLDCRKNKKPFPTLNTLGNRLEEALLEITSLRKQMESLRKENEILRQHGMVDDSSDDSSTEQKDVVTPTKSGFISSNNFEKTPPSRDVLSNFNSPPTLMLTTADSSELKRKRVDQEVDNPTITKKIHF